MPKKGGFHFCYRYINTLYKLYYLSFIPYMFILLDVSIQACTIMSIMSWKDFLWISMSLFLRVSYYCKNFIIWVVLHTLRYYWTIPFIPFKNAIPFLKMLEFPSTLKKLLSLDKTFHGRGAAPWVGHQILSLHRSTHMR